VTNTAPGRVFRYNRLKRRALAVFARQEGWLAPPEWAVLARFYPIRAAYSYLLRLHRFGLLERRRSRNAVLYHLSSRGKVRLAWLEQTQDSSKMR